MRRFIGIAIALSLAVGLTSSRASGGYGGGYSMSSNKGAVIVSFKTMYGVGGPFLGVANSVRGVPGDELPWIVKSAKGSLTSKGKLSITVKGLVFPDDPSVPPELRGINDETEFRALVSCLTVEGGTVIENNLITPGFAASAKGNAKIKAMVNLPQPCLAPIVMILGGDEDKWFAATGF